jgi:hypothetical protein
MVSIKLITAITLALAATVSSAPASHGHHHNTLVRGKYFDRFMVVVLENQDYEVRICGLLRC